ncbi:MAG TPA: 4Fe-4S dicluster domain-containing protein [Deltaproteobacteria bacterium]|nr:4Fe-4S dicluster domain-containing protein [Deltaproteobacteria bacterium]
MVPRTGRRRPIRPPGALPEPEFLKTCVRCYQCGDVCPNQCIAFHGLDDGLAEAGTPFIDPRTQGCIACMKCTEVCPSGALQPTDPDPETVPGRVKMGVARLNRDMCYSYAEPARTCGVCYRACPFPGKAMRIEVFERPVVDRDLCIGCGLCEASCIHLPQAIRIVPVDREVTA